MRGRDKFVKDAKAAERYYRNETDILRTGVSPRRAADDPLHNADNRIPSSFHGLLVNQAAAYLFADPPIFDIGGNRANKALTAILGDRYAKTCKGLCVDACNCAVAWVHVWRDEDGPQYARIDPKQVIPLWTDDLNRRLQAVIRSYSVLQEDGRKWDIVEIWTDEECASYHRRGGGYQSIESHCTFFDPNGIPDNTYHHGYGFVPFVPFFNNGDGNDLTNIKGLIDAYDKVFNGFLNDLEDVQEVILTICGYEGTDLDELKGKLKKYKMVNLDADTEGGSPGMSALTINIPVEARDKMLQMTRKAIFERGMGIDPDPSNFGNSSGVALGYLYSLLEIKAGLKETEFRLGFAQLIRYLCQLAGIPCKEIRQTWTRTSVSNDIELAQIARDSVGIISDKTIRSRHPWVEDAEEEEKRLKKQREAESDPYSGVLSRGGSHEPEE